MHQLGLIAPDISQTYPAMVSIFGEVFDRAEPQLNLKWLQLKNVLGLPHKVDLNALEQIARFAEVELNALSLMGGPAGQNTGLPRTDNQKMRDQQLKNGEKKKAADGRAAAAHASQPVKPAAKTANTKPQQLQMPKQPQFGLVMSNTILTLAVGQETVTIG